MDPFPIVCNTQAIPSAARPRYQELVAKLRAGARKIRPLRNGYEFLLDDTRISLAELAEWIELERRCCGFLEFQVETGPRLAGLALRLRGPRGTRKILEAALLPISAPSS